MRAHARTHASFSWCPKETTSSSFSTRRIILVHFFHTLSSVLLMYCNAHLAHLHLSPSFFSPPRPPSLPPSLLPPFCSSDCDELSHLKCFLSRCIPGGFQSLSIFPCPRTSPPTATSPPGACVEPHPHPHLSTMHTSPPPSTLLLLFPLSSPIPVSCLFSSPPLISASVSSLYSEEHY